MYKKMCKATISVKGVICSSTICGKYMTERLDKQEAGVLKTGCFCPTAPIFWVVS